MQIVLTSRTMNFRLNTPKYMMRSLRSNIGPSTRKASFAPKLNSVNDAATNASASLHRLSPTARSIITNTERPGVCPTARTASRGISTWKTAAAAAPIIRNTAMWKKSLIA